MADQRNEILGEAVSIRPARFAPADRPVWPGTRGPAAPVTERPRPSMRRTMSVDFTWPHGPHGAIHVDGRGRDLHTDRAWSATTLGAAGLGAVIDAPDGTVIELATDVRTNVVAALIGSPARLARRHPAVQALEDTGSESVLGALLDDLPIVLVIAEGARRRLLGRELHPTQAERAQDAQLIDICAGWASGGAMAASTVDDGPLFLGHGPPAVSVGGAHADDFHELPHLGIGSLRRLRRIDITPTLDPEIVTIDGYFRDSFVEASGIETAIHEYEVSLEVDRLRRTVRAALADAHVLPGPQCSGAAPSAALLAGVELDHVRTFVERELRGTIGCTHLNDTLRMCWRVMPLIGTIEAEPPCH